MSPAPLHVVFGAGQVGFKLAATLRDRGLRVRIVRRSAASIPGIDVVSGDVRDVGFATEAARGAAVVYHCMNPSKYTSDAWAREFPAMGEGVIAAAVAHNARLVVLDNLYAYGVVDGKRSEDTPLAATGRKGRVRTAWDHRLRNEPRLRWVVGRAGDFFGPGSGDRSLLSPERLGERGGPWLFGDPTAEHAFSWVPDVVAGLAAFGTAERDVEGQVFHLPVVSMPPAELVARVAAARGVPARSRRIPMWLFRLLAPFVGLLGEIRETIYQWDRPFLVDDAKFRRRFPDVAAPLDVVLRNTAADVEARVGAPSSGALTPGASPSSRA